MQAIILQVSRSIELCNVQTFDMKIPEDGDQDLAFLMRDLENTVRELVADRRQEGEIHLQFTEYRDAQGLRVFHHPNGTLSFQELARKAGPDVVPICLKLFSDGTYGRTNNQYHPMYCEYISSSFCFILSSCNYFIVIHCSSL